MDWLLMCDWPVRAGVPGSRTPFPSVVSQSYPMRPCPKRKRKQSLVIAKSHAVLITGGWDSPISVSLANWWESPVWKTAVVHTSVGTAMATLLDTIYNGNLSHTHWLLNIDWHFRKHPYRSQWNCYLPVRTELDEKQKEHELTTY